MSHPEVDKPRSDPPTCVQRDRKVTVQRPSASPWTNQWGWTAALEGCDRIVRLAKSAGSRIEILPAAGITPENVHDLIHATSCNQVHGSFRQQRQDPAGCVASGSYPTTCQKHVAAARAALDRA